MASGRLKRPAGAASRGGDRRSGTAIESAERLVRLALESSPVTHQPLGSHYLLHERIGQGGMGVVWRALDVSTDSWYAIKVLNPDYLRDPSAVARFIRERSAMVALRHPNIVSLHDMIVEGEQFALVMDLLPDGDLSRCRRDRGGTLAPREAAEMTAQICAGLAAVHAAGIVHRDLKPANVLLDQGNARLTDFGIARIVGDETITETGAVIGTASYMAPEVFRGEKPSAAGDVYAAGVTLYELLTGRPPFTGHIAAVMHDHLHTAPRRADSIPDPLWELIAACLGKEPATRPTAAELASALRDPGLLPGPAEHGGSRAVGADAKPAAAAAPISLAADSGPAPRGTTEPAGAAADTSPTVVRAAATEQRAAEQQTALRQAADQQAAVGAVRQFLESEPTQAPAPPGASGNQSRVKRRRRRALAAAAAAVLAGAGTWVAIAIDGSGHAAPRQGNTAAELGSQVGHSHAASPGPSVSVRMTFTPLPSSSGSSAQSQHNSPSGSASPDGNASPDPAATAGDDPSAGPQRTAAPTTQPPEATGPAAPPAASTGWVIKNSASTWCLGVTGSSTAAGALIAQGHCAEDTSQQWHVTATVTADGYVYYQYRNGHSGLCLDVSGSSATSGAYLVQSTCSDTSDHAQFWRNEDTAAGSGGYHLVNYHSGMCMGVQGSSLKSGAKVLQGNCSSNGTQIWLTAAGI
jgi:Protein kinase domain/Ricin-type beta-trefoil lectin domain-like